MDRFFHPDLVIPDVASTSTSSAAASERTVELEADEARHARDALRKRVGDHVVLFDGLGHEATAEVCAVSKRGVEVVVDDVRHVPRVPAVTIEVIVGLPRAGAADDVVKRAIEAGASRIIPLVSRRSVHRPEKKARSGRSRDDRFRRLAVAAMKQCGRNVMPTLDAPVALDDLELDGAWGCFGSPYVNDGEPNIGAVEAALVPFPARVRCVIGPEGGLAPEEEATLVARGFEAVGVGLQVLRVETAVIAFVTRFAAIPSENVVEIAET